MAIAYWDGNQASGEALTAGRVVTMSSGTIIHADTPATLPLGVVLHDCDSGDIPVVLIEGTVNVIVETSNTPSAGELLRVANSVAAGKAAEASATAIAATIGDVAFEWVFGRCVQDTADEGASGDNMVRADIFRQPLLNIYDAS